MDKFGRIFQLHQLLNSYRCPLSLNALYYRSNRYLDAFCHLREKLRTFSLDRLSPAETLQIAAKEVSNDILDKHRNPGLRHLCGQTRAQCPITFHSSGCTLDG